MRLSPPWGCSQNLPAQRILLNAQYETKGQETEAHATEINPTVTPKHETLMISSVTHIHLVP